jgi:uncharacterized membrane protein
MMGYGTGFGGGLGGGLAGLLWMGGGLLMMIGVIVLVVWLVAKVLERPQVAGNTTSPPPAAPDPLGILQGRFARGEITEAEFSQAKRVLGIDR